MTNRKRTLWTIKKTPPLTRASGSAALFLEPRYQAGWALIPENTLVPPFSRSSSSGAQEVEDHRNQRKEQQEVNEKARRVKDDKAADPRRKKH
jgi:hypothetical protein